MLLYIENDIKCRVIHKRLNSWVCSYTCMVKMSCSRWHMRLHEYRRQTTYIQDFKNYVPEMEKIIDTLNEDIWCSRSCGDFHLPGYSWQITNEVANGFHAVWQVQESVTILENFSNRSQYKQLINVTKTLAIGLDSLFSDINNINANNLNDPLVTVLASTHPHAITTAYIKKLKPL